MSTFMFKNNIFAYTPISNIFIDKYMPKARGEYVKVYILALKYCTSGELGVSSSVIAGTLHLLETDVMNAWNYWNDEGIIKLHKIDNAGNFHIEFLNITEDGAESSENGVNILQELKNNSTKDMLQDIEKLMSRPLSSKEISMYIGWIKELNFSPEILLLMIQYCTSKGKSDSRYIEKVALNWHENKINTLEDAQSYIKKSEDKWIYIKKITSYLGLRDMDVMKPQEQLMDKWMNVYKYSNDIIFKACDICAERLNRPDFKYIDGILSNWFKKGVKTVEDIPVKDHKKDGNYKSNYGYDKKPDTFNNYEQRSYDYDDLEKKLLGWDNNND